MNNTHRFLVVFHTLCQAESSRIKPKVLPSEDSEYRYKNWSSHQYMSNIIFNRLDEEDENLLKLLGWAENGIEF